MPSPTRTQVKHHDQTAWLAIDSPACNCLTPTGNRTGGKTGSRIGSRIQPQRLETARKFKMRSSVLPLQILLIARIYKRMRLFTSRIPHPTGSRTNHETLSNSHFLSQAARNAAHFQQNQLMHARTWPNLPTSGPPCPKSSEQRLSDSPRARPKRQRTPNYKTTKPQNYITPNR